MRIFVAGILTETNTFAPSATGMASFEAMGIRRADGRGVSPAFGPATDLLDALAAEEGHVIVPGLLAIAQPGGPVLRSTHEALRDELLAGLRVAGPVDAVILLLHGAMVAEGEPDCEGDLIERVRAVVGPAVSIGVELDLHCHLSRRMVERADVLVAYKAYPHTDVLDRLRELWRLAIGTARGAVRPTTAVVDCRMNGLWPTTREPMATFVRRLQAVEAEEGVLGVSLGHGFPWGDVADAGAKLWVVTDNDPALARRWADALAREFFDLREATRSEALTVEVALDRVAHHTGGRPLVLADIADNPGGGAGGDSRFVLRALLERNSDLDGICLGGLWDPTAVRACFDAGASATIALRVGGHSGPAAGDPVDLVSTVMALRTDHGQRALDGASQSCGPSAWIRVGGTLDLVLISERQQVLGTDLFTGLGIDLAGKRAVVVKSQQHFHAAFGPLADDVLYVDTPGLLCTDVTRIAYRHRDPEQWPHVALPAAWTLAPAVDFLP